MPLFLSELERANVQREACWLRRPTRNRTCPSVRLDFDSKAKRLGKLKKKRVNISRGSGNRCANFRLKRVKGQGHRT